MISEALLDLVQGACTWLLSLIPDLDMPGWWDPAGIRSTMGDLGTRVSVMGSWVPWTTLSAVLVTVWAIRSGMATFSLLMKLYAVLRGGAS